MVNGRRMDVRMGWDGMGAFWQIGRTSSHSAFLLDRRNIFARSLRTDDGRAERGTEGDRPRRDKCFASAVSGYRQILQFRSEINIFQYLVRCQLPKLTLLNFVCIRN